MTALRWLLEQPGHRILIVANTDRKHYLLHAATRLLPGGHDPANFIKRHIEPQIVVVHELDRVHRAFGRANEVGIDDAEEVLSILFNARVEFVTLNATLIPVVSSSTINGDYIDAEQDAISGRKMIGRPIRDDPQA